MKHFQWTFQLRLIPNFQEEQHLIKDHLKMLWHQAHISHLVSCFQIQAQQLCLGLYSWPHGSVEEAPKLWACFFTPSNCSSWSRTLLWSLPLSNLLRPTHFLSGLCPFTFDSALLGPSFWSCFCWPSESASLLKQYQVGTSSLGKSIHSLCLASAQLPYWTHTAAYHVFIPCFLSHSSFKIMSLAAVPSSQPFFTIPNSWSLFLVLCQYPWLLFSIYALPFFSFSFFPLFTSLPFQPQPKFLL